MGDAPLPSKQEAKLLTRARADSAKVRDAAFQELFNAFSPSLFTLCARMALTPTEVEDAVQDTFFAVYQGIASFRGTARFSTWLYRIALRAALKVRARRPPNTEPLQHDPPAVPRENPLLAKEQAQRLSAALGRLSAEHRAVLSLFAVDGLLHREIAEILGVPEGTVWSRLHLARKRLLAELAER